MPLPADAHIGSVSLTVSDLDRSVSFDRDVLGFLELTREGPAALLSTAGDRSLRRLSFEPMVRGCPGALFVAAGGYHHHLGMNTWAGAGAPPPPENAVGLLAFTIEARSLESRQVDDVATRTVVGLVGG